MAARNTRIGWWLFAIYLVLYAGFVLFNVVSPTTMEREVLGGLNLAIVYGFGLILAAFGLAMVYGVLCGRGSQVDETSAANTPEEQR